MPRRRYKKPYRAKKKKPLWAKASFWRFAGGLSLTGGIVWLICFCPALEVKEINVNGTQKINEQDCASLIESKINKKLAFFESKSILLFNLEQTKKQILSHYPQIQDIKIERKFPSQIYASVKERQEVANFNSADSVNYLIDGQGIVFESAPEDKDLLTINDPQPKEIKIGSLAIAKNTLDAIFRIKGQIDSNEQFTITQAQLASPERINLLTSEGWYIYFNPLKDIDQQLLKLTAILNDESFKTKRNNLEYLDIRFTRVYLREKNLATSENNSLPHNQLEAATSSLAQ